MQTNEPISNPNQQTQSSQPALKKKLPLWLTIILFLLLIGFTGLLAYQNYQLKQQIQQIQKVSPDTLPNSSITPTQTPKSDFSPPVTDQAANWQTYQNSEFNFSLKYPLSWLSEELAGVTIIKSNTELTNEQLTSLGG